MRLLDTKKLTDDALQAYDSMMLEVCLKVPDVAPLSVLVWANVLEELGTRSKVSLVSGSYDQPGDALIRRHYSEPS